MRTDLFRNKRIKCERLRSQKGASVVFALVGFMFAAMISLVVINAAYSAGSRVKKLRYDEQTFLLAQSMTGMITEALAGDGNNALLPIPGKNIPITTPKGQLKYDGLTVGYQYIEREDVVINKDDPDLETKTIDKFYNSTTSRNVFTKNNGTGTSKGTFIDFYRKTSFSDPGVSASARIAVQDMIIAMAKKIDQGEASVTETITTTHSDTNGVYSVSTTFTMDKSYSIKAITTATVKKTAGGADLSTYTVRMDAPSDLRTDKQICVGTKTLDGSGKISTIEVDYDNTLADDEAEEVVKVSFFLVTWPPEQIRSSFYVTPAAPVTPGTP